LAEELVQNIYLAVAALPASVARLLRTFVARIATYRATHQPRAQAPNLSLMRRPRLGDPVTPPPQAARLGWCGR
jgi:hypothetical protein